MNNMNNININFGMENKNNKLINNNNLKMSGSKNNIKCINVNEVENEDNEMNTEENSKSLGQKEYILCLRNALQDAISENEKVRN